MFFSPVPSQSLQYTNITEALLRNYPEFRSYYNPLGALIDHLSHQEIQQLPSISNITTFLPSFLFPNDMRLLASLLEQESRLDMQGCICSILGSINTAMCGVYYVQPKNNWREPLIDYWMVLARPGSMKTSVITALKKPHNDFQNELENDFILNHLDKETLKERKRLYKKEKERFLKEKLTKLTGENRYSPDEVRRAHEEAERYYNKLSAGLKTTTCPRLFWQAGTMKGLADLMAEQNGYIGVMDSEDTFLEENFLCTHPDSTLFLRGWDCATYQRTVHGKEIIVKNASFPLLLIIQPGVARNLFSNKQLNIKGVLARFLCYWTPSQQHQEGIVEIVSAQKHKKFILENYQNKIYQLLKRSCNFRKERKFIEIPLTSEAEDFLREKKRHYEKLMERSEYEFLSDWLGKAHGFLLRITGDIHCWNNPEAPELTPITKSEMLDAASLLDNLQKHAEYSFCPSQIAACEDAKRILLYFKYHKNIYPFFDSCILYQNIRGLNSVKVNIALNLMSQLYYIALIPKRRGGFFFFFYPNLHNFIYNKL